jgi:UDP-glucose 4-epimerase
METQKQCLVTGAAGFIGSHLVDRLLERGHAVMGVDNLKLGRRSNLGSAFGNPRFQFHQADVNDLPAMRALLTSASKSEPIGTVWHLAANSDIRAGVADPEVDLRDTFMSTFNVLRLMREFGIPRIAFASTSAVYGDFPGLLVENVGPLFPISNYGAMKLASEAIISAALESYLKQVWIFRFPNVVGSRSTHGAIFDFVHKLRKNPAELEVLGDGTQEKPYFHVADLVEAMLFITDHARDRLNYFNIGTADSITTVRYLAEAVVREMSPGARIKYGTGNKGWVGDVPKFQYSIEKLKKLGWSPRLTSNQAVDRAVAEVVAEVKAQPSNHG